MDKVVIKEDRCKSCGLCIEFCPKNILSEGTSSNSKGFYPVVVSDQQSCTGCQNCEIMCPDSVITINRDIQD